MNSFQEKTNIALDKYGIKPLFKHGRFWYKSFEEARKFSRSLNLNGFNDWKEYHKKNRPEGIPKCPDCVYEDKGWISWGDFLGTGYVYRHSAEYKTFEEARKFARSLKLKSKKEWEKYHNENKPEEIPYHPERTYKDKGWISLGDFLGNGYVHKDCVEPFEKAREIVRSLKLTGVREWRRYYKRNKPDNLPYCADRVYKDKGWVSWGDFLGNGYIAAQYKVWISFKEARKFAHSLKLKNFTEWHIYHKENKPKGIPASPDKIYKRTGEWTNWHDFLGK